eukprot:XP_011666152.1 PREDICTED: major facilitator superfamily domain-containing protein 10 [Strongylocentrotus purpuratus]
MQCISKVCRGETAVKRRTVLSRMVAEMKDISFNDVCAAVQDRWFMLKFRTAMDHVSDTQTEFVVVVFLEDIPDDEIPFLARLYLRDGRPYLHWTEDAMIGLAFSVGFIVGPMIGAYFATKGGLFAEGAWAVTPALLALTLSIADLLFVFAFLKETLPQEKRAPSMGNSFQERQNLINPFSLFRFSAVKNTNTKEMQILQQLGLSYFLYLFLFSGLEFTLTFLVHIRFQYTSMQQGKMFVFMGLIMAALQGGYVRRIKPGQEKRVALTGMLILIPAFVIIAFSSGSFLYYLGLALFSIASGTVVPCMTTIVTMYGPEDQKGTIMGIFRSLGALSRAFGPAAASAVYWGAGAGVCYIWGAVLMVFPIYILTRVIPAKTQ